MFAIGLPGPPRNTPDFYALQVMNHLLGGLFQSRLNHNIREVRGYSYGVSSSFAFGRGPGAFRAGGGVDHGQDRQRADRVHEGVPRRRRARCPFTDDEIQQGKESLIQSLPGGSPR